MIGRASRQLPPQMPAPPSYQKSNPADQSVILFVLRSATLPLAALDEYAQQTVAQRISMISGVAQVDVFGSQKFAVRIDADPRKLAAYSIGIDEVADAVSNANSNLPTGTIYGEKTFVVQSNGQLLKASAFGPTIIAYRNGNPVRLEEVAHVYDGVENDKSASWQAGERCVMLSIRKQPGTNVVEVVDRIKAILPTFREQLPPSVALDIRSDRSLSIRDSVHDVKVTLLITIALVVLVIFLFLRNISATLIPSLALPGSLVGTFMVMYALGYSLDNLSLMALTLVGRLRRRRRDRDAGKHRPAHGDGQAADAGGARRVEGDRLHDHLDDDLARRRVHSRAVHGRHRRPAAPRVFGDHRRRDSGVRLRVDQPHADAVQPVPETDPRAASRLAVQRVRADVRRLAAALRRHAAPEPAVPRRHHARLGGADRRHGVSVHRDSEGLPAERGPGPVPGEHGSRAGHQLPGDGPPSAAGRRHHREGSGRLRRERQRRPDRQQLRFAEHRPHLGRAEAARPSGRSRSTRRSPRCARRSRNCPGSARS